MTKRLYYSEPYVTEFVARMISCEKDGDKFRAVLDKTFFYPESGGQPNDTGSIGGCKVIDVQIDDGIVYHTVDREICGDEVRCSIDRERRVDHMQQHTGQHILSQAIYGIFGKDSESLHMGRKISSIDIPIAELTKKDLMLIEKRANEVVFADVPVKTYFVDSTEGLGLRKETDLDSGIRIVEIGDYDRTPCGGTHLSSTGQVGLIKIARHYKKGKYTRIEFICGGRCLEKMQEQGETILGISNHLMVPQDSILERVKELDDAKRVLETKIEELGERLSVMTFGSLIENSASIGGVTVVKDVINDPKMAHFISKSTQARDSTVSLLAFNTSKGATMMFSCSKDCDIDIGKILSESVSIVSGRGGGGKSFASGSCNDVSRLDEALDHAFGMVRETLDAAEK